MLTTKFFIMPQRVTRSRLGWNRRRRSKLTVNTESESKNDCELDEKY